jgi:hypothetical protein
MKKIIRSDDGWNIVPARTYVKKKSKDLIEVFKDPDIVGAKIVQTTKDGCQSLYVNNENLVKMEAAFLKNGWEIKV